MIACTIRGASVGPEYFHRGSIKGPKRIQIIDCFQLFSLTQNFLGEGGWIGKAAFFAIETYNDELRF